MHITLEDICGMCGMASPGWGEGSAEIPDPDLLDDLDGEAASDESRDGGDDYSEVAFSLNGKSQYEPEQDEKPDVKGLYTDVGTREGLSTLEICTRLKNRPLRRDILEQEFFAIRKIYPANGADLKILIWLAAGRSYKETAELVGRTTRTIKNAVHRLREFRDHGTVKLVPAEQAQSLEAAALREPLPKSKAGRKPKKTTEITTVEIIRFDLFGDPIQVRERKARRQAAGVRRTRVRPTMPGQLSLFDMAA